MTDLGGRGRGPWIELALAVGILAATLAVAAVWVRAREHPLGGGSRAFQIVRPATPAPVPRIALSDLAGRRVHLEDFRGRVILLNFWATWCEPCRAEMPAMEALSRDLTDRGLTVVAVNYQEPVRAVQAYVRELGVTFPILRDAEGQVARELHVPGLPATFLIGRDGAVIGTALGYRDWNAPEARAFISELLAAPPRGVAAR